MSKITQNTLLPISLIASLGYIVFQVGTSYSKVEAHEKRLEAMHTETESTLKALKSIENRLVRIETLLAK